MLITSARTLGQSAQVPEDNVAQSRCVLLEIYLKAGEPESERVLAEVRAFEKVRDGLTVVVRDVTGNEKNQTRLNNIQSHFKIEQASLPLIYGCNRTIYRPSELKDVAEQLKLLLRLDVFVRAGCQRCAEAKRVLPGILGVYLSRN